MSVHIVMTGYDHSVFEPYAASDTRERLQRYAALLLQKDPEACLTYLALRAPKQVQAFSAGGVHFTPVFSSSALMPLRLWQALSSLRPASLIFTQTPYEDGLVSLLFCWINRIALGVQVHNDPAFAPGGLFSPLRRLMAAITFRCARLVRVVNPVIAEPMKKALGPRLKIIPVAVGITAIPRLRLPDQPTVLIVSRLSPEKGVDIALEVMAQVQKQRADIRLLIAGDGAERSALEAQASQLGVNATFLGAVSPTDLPAYFSNATLLLLSSRQEGWGRVLIEAMQSAIPVVATRTRGAAYLVQNGKTGFLHDQDDCDGMASSILTLCQSTDLNQQMGRAGLEFGQQFQPEETYRQLVAALLDAINKPC